MIHLGSIATLLLFCFSRCVAAEPTFNDYAMKESILKIDVTYENSKRNSDGEELCKSEGTGFIVSSNNVVTAKHVIDFDPECGKPTILGKSFADNSQTLLKLLDSQGDIVLLASEVILTQWYASSLTTLESHPCAIAVSQIDNSFEQEGAVRYGVPGGLIEPVIVPVSIGSATGQFAPLVSITPTKVEHGESGGPIVKDYLVVGIIESQVVSASMIGLMAKGTEIFKLLQRNNVRQPKMQESCNPALYSLRQKNAFLQSLQIQISDGASGLVGKVAFSEKLIEEPVLQQETIEVARVAVVRSLSEILQGQNIEISTHTEGSATVVFTVMLSKQSGAFGHLNMMPDGGRPVFQDLNSQDIQGNCNSSMSDVTCSRQITEFPPPYYPLRSAARIQEALRNGYFINSLKTQMEGFFNTVR